MSPRPAQSPSSEGPVLLLRKPTQQVSRPLRRTSPGGHLTPQAEGQLADHHRPRDVPVSGRCTAARHPPQHVPRRRPALRRAFRGGVGQVRTCSSRSRPRHFAWGCVWNWIEDGRITGSSCAGRLDGGLRAGPAIRASGSWSREVASPVWPLIPPVSDAAPGELRPRGGTPTVRDLRPLRRVHVAYSVERAHRVTQMRTRGCLWTAWMGGL